ncbi:MAG: hypothetical protein H6Q55_2991 [Deltaproteobacteria bacterium]|nr:hypothetical protein [Deltaproteobacteria bacterium]
MLQVLNETTEPKPGALNNITGLVEYRPEFSPV